MRKCLPKQRCDHVQEQKVCVFSVFVIILFSNLEKWNTIDVIFDFPSFPSSCNGLKYKAIRINYSFTKQVKIT